MEEIKDYFFPEFNTTSKNNRNSIKNNKKIYYNINMLLSPEELNHTKQKQNEFYQNKTTNVRFASSL